MLIFHVDMNSFFASCEQSENPDLLGKQVIICGDPENRSGIVLAASYEAKRAGVRTTMLISEAKRLCPMGIFLPCQHRFYSDVSRKVMAIFDEFTPLKEQASIDEAYLDMTGTERLFGKPADAAVLIQKTVKERLGIGCSIGISTNKLLAKMGSDMKKPMGITELFPDMVEDKMWPLRVGDLFGVGKKTAEKLEGMGIRTIGDLAATDEKVLKAKFGNALGDYLSRSSRGDGETRLIRAEEYESQSIGNENTYSHDLTEMEQVSQALLYIAESVGYRLRKAGKKGKTVTVKIKYSDFTLATRGKTFDFPTDSTDAVYESAIEIFKAGWSGKPIRLLGISVSGFEEVEQESLFGYEDIERKRNIDKSVDSLREKFGFDSIKRASLLGKDRK